MTRAACALILHVSTLRLCWRSIKALKSTKDVDPEIPKLWSLVAFHTIYASVMEFMISWLPFYFYIKMLLLAVTFIPGTKFPAYWFDCFLVPGIDKLHHCLDFDWRQFLVHQAKYLPLILLDTIFLPGILADEERNDRTGKIAVEVREEAASSALQSPSSARSKIVASGLHLRSFSRKHNTPAKGSPRKKRPETSAPATPSSAEGTAIFAASARTRRRRRRTTNQKVRKVFCGHENIRIRDYLFDLDMPSLPATSGEGPQLGSVGDEVTQRRFVSSADRGSASRQKKRDAKNTERRRRTYGGARGRSDFGQLDKDTRLGGCNEKPAIVPREVDQIEVGEISNTENEDCSNNITVRRSKRLGRRKKNS